MIMGTTTEVEERNDAAGRLGRGTPVVQLAARRLIKTGEARVQSKPDNKRTSSK